MCFVVVMQMRNQAGLEQIYIYKYKIHNTWCSGPMCVRGCYAACPFDWRCLGTFTLAWLLKWKWHMAIGKNITYTSPANDPCGYEVSTDTETLKHLVDCFFLQIRWRLFQCLYWSERHGFYTSLKPYIYLTQILHIKRSEDPYNLYVHTI